MGWTVMCENLETSSTLTEDRKSSNDLVIKVDTDPEKLKSSIAFDNQEEVERHYILGYNWSY